MTKRGEFFCIVCGKKHEYCPSCGKGSIRESWKTLYDTMECRRIFSICSGYTHKHITADEAKKKLIEMNATDASKFTEDIKAAVTAIMAESSFKKEVATPNDAPTPDTKKNDSAESIKNYNNNKFNNHKDHGNNNPNAFKKSGSFVNNNKN